MAGDQVPVTPFGELVARLGAVDPEQKSAIAAKPGCVLGVIATAKVCVVAHCPASGVNTYEPAFVLSITAGDHEPVMPNGEVVAKLGAAVPEQISGIAANDGLIFGAVIFTFNVCVVAHCPASGVNTYEPAFVLSITAGDHEPVMPNGEVVAKLGAAVPEQKEGIGANDGLIVEFITIGAWKLPAAKHSALLSGTEYVIK